ncbi:MAG: YifB family Mg chelatase-like AAA ATPase [Frankiaceae bacterium]
MPLARTHAVALLGVTGHVVEVEADLAQGLPALSIIGLPDAALAESRDRVRSAIVNSGLSWPQRRITIGLSPASLPKAGSAFDLAVAAAVLAAAGVVAAAAVASLTFVGELALDGRVRPVRGVLAAALAAVRHGRPHVVVPLDCLAEAVLVPGVVAWGVESLAGLVARLTGTMAAGDPDGVVEARYGDPLVGTPPRRSERPELADVVGQPDARRAAEVAAAGGHHLFLHGPPGTGKTMLAERLPGLLPDLDTASALEVTAVHSVAGELEAGCPLLVRPPFRSPHHTASVPALVGGGSGVARPGAVSLAHRGVLFLDEAPEFATGVLDALRQPLESGEVVIARSGGAATYPARFLLVLAANPCPCARAGSGPLDCTCSPPVRRRYLGRLSGPLLDRIDLQCEMEPLSPADLMTDRQLVEPTAVVADRVAAARAAALERYAGTPWQTNAEVPGRTLRDRWAPTRAGRRVAEDALARGHLTVRGYDRVLRVAWTVADLTTGRAPDAGEVADALYLRAGAVVRAA